MTNKELMQGLLLGTSNKKNLHGSMPDWLQNAISAVVPSNPEDALLYMNSLDLAYQQKSKKLQEARADVGLQLPEETKELAPVAVIDSFKYLVGSYTETAYLLRYLLQAFIHTNWRLPNTMMMDAFIKLKAVLTQKEFSMVLPAFGNAGVAVAQNMFPTLPKVSKIEELKQLGEHSTDALLKQVEYECLDYSKPLLADVLELLKTKVSNDLTPILDKLAPSIEAYKGKVKVEQKIKIAFLWLYMATSRVGELQYVPILEDMFEPQSTALKDHKALKTVLQPIMQIVESVVPKNIDATTYCVSFILSAVPLDRWVAILETDAESFLNTFAKSNMMGTSAWKVDLYQASIIDNFYYHQQTDWSMFTLGSWGNDVNLVRYLYCLPLDSIEAFVLEHKLYRKEAFDTFTIETNYKWSHAIFKARLQAWDEGMGARRIDKKVYRFLPYIPTQSDAWNDLSEMARLNLLDYTLIYTILDHRDQIQKRIM